MKENIFLKIISNTLDDSSFLGDDCAVIDNNFVVTQDTLVEEVHFSLKTITPYLLGRKSVVVNLSDIAAALAEPLYITIGLSFPDKIDNCFVKEFYRGINDICRQYCVKVIGGDITKSEKVFISICAIGKKNTKYNVSRKNAKLNDVVFVTGKHGLSACGLFLSNMKTSSADSLFLNAHFQPEPDIIAALQLANKIDEDIAVMDTSDGLGDALMKLSGANSIEIDFNLLQTPKKLFEIANKYSKKPEDWIFWGGEDYHLLCCASQHIFEKLDKNMFFKIGKVIPKSTQNVIIKNGMNTEFINETVYDEKVYKHFS